MPSAALSELIESITVDAYGTDEQLTAFLTAFSEEVRLPCPATVLGMPGRLRHRRRHWLVARCDRDGRRAGVVSLVDRSS